jgi:hypothetical protein
MMTLTFLFSMLSKCTFSANRLLDENKPFRPILAGCRRPRWWFSTTPLVAGLAVLLTLTCYGQQQRRPQGRGQSTRPTTVSGESQVRPTFEGDVKSVTKKELFITSDNGNGLKFRITGKTTAYDNDKKIQVSSLAAGQHVAVEVQINLDGSYDAVNIKVQAATPPHP